MVLKAPLPPSVNLGAVFSKAMTRQEQRVFVYADQDRLVEEGVKLIVEKLLKAFKIIEDHDLDHLLDTGHQERMW